MSKATKRKHVAKELQEDFSIPTEQQFIVQLVDSRGNNLHEVIDSSGEKFLVSMPVKFRRNIWVKRGDFVLVEPIPEGDKVKAEIAKILTKEHIKFYRSQKVWPKTFEDKVNKNNQILQGIKVEVNKKKHSSDDSDTDDDEDLFVNTNRNFGPFSTGRNEPEDSSSDSD
ncbi:probable RNA-binding protein EIF1AD [Chelonus insularis]|uniref:probable RNA-binding protein EIF1AD n=1 Tax=Chelonus insularis TaxID=460826 RepID=UPI001589486B|nr:probable RNA-binding protein EIF1AD [Chelonus insularis]